MQAAAVSASDGIGIGAPPSDLSDFMAWVNRNGDHFAGDQSARKHLMQSVESLQRMHSQLAQERSKFKMKVCAGLCWRIIVTCISSSDER